MATYRCRLATATGEIIDRDFTAQDPSLLRRELERQDYLVLSVQRRSSVAAAAGEVFHRRAKVRMNEFLFFNQELVALVRAGLPIVESLSLLAERRKHPVFKHALEDVRDRVKGGEALSDAFAAQGLFPPLYASTLAAGERSGEIATVISRFIKYQKTILGVKRKVIAALTYPAILVGLALVLILILMTYVLPQFESFFKDFGAELPGLTRGVLGVSRVIRDYWLVWLAGGAGLFVALTVWKKTPAGQRWLENFVYRVPVVGSIARKFVVTRFARTLATLIAGGIPMVTCLEIVGRAIGTQIYGAATAGVASKIREGAALWSSLDETQLYPDLMIEMVKVGESSGAVAEMLEHVADFTDEEIEHELQTLVSLVEPALLVAMALIVGMLLLAIYYPLLKVYASSQNF
ncbi:MAG: type II secretion system F family protein [Acidobacteria bacterium]|nr:type II secretion system F family protein [Acidobacteriota bacterium]